MRTELAQTPTQGRGTVRFPQLQVLFVGQASGTSRHRFHALQRLGCQVDHVDPYTVLPWRRGLAKLLYETGAAAIDHAIVVGLAHRLKSDRYDIAFVNGGELLGPRAVELLHRTARIVVNYNNDNPFSDRDKNKWRLYLRAVPLYDLLVVVHETSVAPAQELGCQDVMRVFLCADEVAHVERPISEDLLRKHCSDVAFVGTWMPERGPFMARLISLGVPVSIWGDRWRRATEWHAIKSSWRGPGIYDDDEYAAALLGSKMCLGLVSKGNLNRHTDRSVQIPALGALLVAERTDEHVKMYEEGSEAVFWSDADECATACLSLLQDQERRSRVAKAGHLRCLRNGYFNEPMLATVLGRALEGHS